MNREWESEKNRGVGGGRWGGKPWWLVAVVGKHHEIKCTVIKLGLCPGLASSMTLYLLAEVLHNVFHLLQHQFETWFKVQVEKEKTKTKHKPIINCWDIIFRSGRPLTEREKNKEEKASPTSFKKSLLGYQHPHTLPPLPQLNLILAYNAKQKADRLSKLWSSWEPLLHWLPRSNMRFTEWLTSDLQHIIMVREY